jgi:hypothetical protein
LIFVILIYNAWIKQGIVNHHKAASSYLVGILILVCGRYKMRRLIEAAKCRRICKFSRCVQTHPVSHKVVAARKSALSRFAMIFGIIVESHCKNALSLFFIDDFKVALF